MCHTIDYYHNRHHQNHRLIKLKSITLHLSISAVAATTTLLPDTLTFVFLPRINGTPITINNSTYPADSPAFISLHRRTFHSSDTSAVFISGEHVAFSDGAVFEVHIGENRLIHGVFRRSNSGNLKMECKCLAERYFGVEEAMIVVAEENGGVMREKVKVTAEKRRRFCRKYEVALVEIPEERECDVAEEEEEEVDVEASDVERCNCCGEAMYESDSGYEFDEKMMEMEIEGVKWAVDVGIWAVCIGVGLLVSKASLRSLRRRKKFLL